MSNVPGTGIHYSFKLTAGLATELSAVCSPNPAIALLVFDCMLDTYNKTSSKTISCLSTFVQTGSYGSNVTYFHDS